MQFLALAPLVNGLVASVAFALVGIVLAVIGYRLFDLATPGDLHKEIFENKNVAAAILGGSLVLGLCFIIAAAIGG